MSGHARACMVLTNQLVYNVVAAVLIDVKNCLHDDVVRVEVGGDVGKYCTKPYSGKSQNIEKYHAKAYSVKIGQIFCHNTIHP